MIIDTHAHYDDEQFDTDREELLDSMEAGGIGLIVNAGSTVESWDKIVRLTERYPFLYGAIGVHPDEAGSLDEEKFSRMSDLLDLDKIVAVGEIGLDLRSAYAPTPEQTAWFERQIEWANQMEKPLIIHQVRATEATQRILHSGARTPVILHGYTGNPSLTAQWLQQVPDVHFSFGFRSLQTPKAVESLKWLATHHPERLFLETDEGNMTIEKLYRKAARTRGLPVHTLRKAIALNITHVFIFLPPGKRFTNI